MSNIVLQPNASGTGNITIATPNTNTNRTLNIPDAAGNIVTTGDTGSISNAMLSGGITSAKFAANAIGEQTTGTGITQKFYFTNVSPNAQPINTSFTLSAAEAPLNSWVGLRLEVLSGSSQGDQYCYIYQQGGTGYNSQCYVNDWYYYSTQTTLFPIRAAGDRTFNVTHGTIDHSSAGDYRKVSYMGYWKVTE